MSKPCGCPYIDKASTHRQWLHFMLQGWWYRLDPLIKEGSPPGKFCSRCLAVSTTYSRGWRCPGKSRQAPAQWAGLLPVSPCWDVSLAHSGGCLAALGGLQPIASADAQQAPVQEAGMLPAFLLGPAVGA